MSSLSATPSLAFRRGRACCKLVMPRHSKNNTASAVFTFAERGMLRDVWGSKSRRLGSESMRHFDQCSLCLGDVKSPVACTRGHLYCRECILSSLLDQKKDLLALQSSLERLAAEHDEQRRRARQEAIDRVQRDFDRAQGLGVGGSGSNGGIRTGSEEGSDDRRATRQRQSPDRTRDRSASPVRASSSKSSLATLPARIALQTERAIAEAIRKLDEEQALAKKQKIPAYWLPSLTPSADANAADIVKRTEEALASKGLETQCYVGDARGHPTSIKSLVNVSFVTESRTAGPTHDSDERPTAPCKICPSCRKTLSDVTQLYTARRCGHVHCANCVESLLMPALKRAEKRAVADKDQNSANPGTKDDQTDRARCLECGTSIKSASKDLIALQREGTGFASGGLSESKQMGISFQG